ncbi:DUF2267 domain-containing protein [uncultured Nitratireductor sp.]|uniref:DUF2267 domain-containing protein n=1 Tax=uncultured Nitratireductor sp. TaxID=520953 RepID=UPI0025D3A60F|nr:DUF2267 domain-containing protein [uncultured Nitratireductor sp.]
MTVPMDYLHASRDFRRFLDAVKTQSMLATHNQCYAMTRAVLHVFRSHISMKDALEFAEILPPLLRVIFIEGWNLDAEITPFPDRQTLLAEVKAVRAPHNVAPETAIGDIAAILRAEVGEATLRRVLKSMPHGAEAYWLTKP